MSASVEPPNMNSKQVPVGMRRKVMTASAANNFVLAMMANPWVVRFWSPKKIVDKAYAVAEHMDDHSQKYIEAAQPESKPLIKV